MADYRKVVGTFISFAAEVDAKKKDGGTYKAFRLIYTNENGEAVTVTKPVQGLKFNQGLERGLKSLGTGDQFVIAEEKNAGGFWEIKTITKGTDTAEPMGLTGAASPAPSTRTTQSPSTGRDFETGAERQAKQTFIIRQSSLERAIENLSIGAKGPLNPIAVIDLAEVFTDFVLNGKPKVERIEDMEDDIPV
jgi:hypothetical protein